MKKSGLDSPGWQRECSTQDYIRQLTLGEKWDTKSWDINCSKKKKMSVVVPVSSLYVAIFNFVNNLLPVSDYFGDMCAKLYAFMRFFSCLLSQSPIL